MEWVALSNERRVVDRPKVSTIKIDDEEICYKYAIIIISIPKDADWTHPETGERRAYKFVSKVFGSNN